MSTSTSVQTKIIEAVNLVVKHGSIAAASRASGIAKSTLSDRYNSRNLLDPGSEESKAKAARDVEKAVGETIETDEKCSKGEMKLFVLSEDKRIESPEEAMKKANIDPKIWTVDRIVLKSYEQGCKVEGVNNKGYKYTRGVAVTPMFGITLWLKRIVPDPAIEAYKTLINEMRKTPISVPKITRPKFASRDRFLFEISLADQHIGKLAWKQEVLEDFDLKIAKRRYLDAANNLLHDVKDYPVEEILMVLGNDYFHVNNAEMTTAKGTPQNVDGRWQKVFTAGKMAAIEAIDMARAVAPVNVMIIPGNHDPEWCYFLGEVLSERYRQAKDVTVDNRPLSRKYKHYGVSLIGFTHGDKEKMSDLPLTMAREMKKQWAEATYYEVHTGHLHKRAETKFNAGDTWNGVAVRILPSLTGTDAWHYTSGYAGGVKSSDAYLWNKRLGLSKIFVVNCPDMDANSPDAS